METISFSIFTLPEEYQIPRKGFKIDKDVVKIERITNKVTNAPIMR
ncbi:hypothetical protein LD85_1166 [Saccharolobus islandicus L.D.8.5]|uniref:Uncharacterized protein n=1 Tax=Saccharolobus islandicus (strain L.D.8.5 / Lassen \|nr:hypothetical protein LD85_1166 [Sulfolobus islandicus L.D.8.5]